MVEYSAFNRGVTGSSPVVPTEPCNKYCYKCKKPFFGETLYRHKRPVALEHAGNFEPVNIKCPHCNAHDWAELRVFQHLVIEYCGKCPMRFKCWTER